MSHFKKYKGFIAEHGRLSIPPMYSGGITLRFPGPASLSLDVQHIGWNRVRALHNPLEPNLQGSLLGAKYGAAFGWHSQTVFRLGADWQIIPCFTVRGGYRWSAEFIPRRQTAVNLLTNEAAVRFYAFGCSLYPSERCEISAFFAHSLSNKLRGRGSIPVTFGGGDVDLKQDKTIAGLGLGWLY
jgi:long-chain fatty acid transport protein